MSASEQQVDLLPPAGEVGHLRERRIHGLLRDVARHEGLTFGSLLDIGCGRSRYDKWFERWERRNGDGRYIGLETDEEIIDELRGEGLDVRHATEEPGDCRSDLVLCLEVIEHILPQDSAEFFEFVAANTNKAMMLTTPNFEYFDGVKPSKEYRECRWIPDHLPTFKPDGGPHHHKQAMTPENLTGYLEAAFPAPDWQVRVFRAWPWRLHDEVEDRSFHLYFKLWALAWRPDAADG